MNKGNGAVITVGIAALILGGVTGYMFNNNTSEVNNADPVAAVQSDAASTRVALNNALREHVSLGAAGLRAAFDGDPNTEQLLGTLDENSLEVAGLVGSVYGEDAEESFLSLWRSHIDFFANYTVAAKAGDEEAMQKALDDLAGYGDEASTFFANANDNLPKDAVQPLLVEHRDLVIEAVNAWGAGNYAESYDAEQRARDQVGDIADALASGIIAQQAQQ